VGYYNVVSPCVVGKLHYARPTVQPIVVDDETAAPLVESGCLEPYRTGITGKTGTVLDGILRMPEVAEVAEDMEPIHVDPEPEKPSRRSRRRTGESDGEAD